MKLVECDSVAANLRMTISGWPAVIDEHDVCPSRAWKGGQEKISLWLFHGELAGRMDLEQAGRSGGDLYEGLS